MNISIFNRTTTQVGLVAGTYYQNVKEKSFAAIMDGYFIYGWIAEGINYGSIRREAITEGEEVSSLSPLAKIITEPEYEVVTRDRFLELLAECMTYIAGEEHT